MVICNIHVPLLWQSMHIYIYMPILGNCGAVSFFYVSDSLECILPLAQAPLKLTHLLNFAKLRATISSTSTPLLIFFETDIVPSLSSSWLMEHLYAGIGVMCYSVFCIHLCTTHVPHW